MVIQAECLWYRVCTQQIGIKFLKAIKQNKQDSYLQVHILNKVVFKLYSYAIGGIRDYKVTNNYETLSICLDYQTKLESQINRVLSIKL